MKRKCPECGTGKARRLCRRVNNAEICSACCASIRSAECGDCPHFAAATRYEVERYRSGSGGVPRSMLMELDPEISATVDEALQQVERGKRDGPMKVLTDLFREYPRHHDVSYGIGVVHAMSGRYEESIEWFDRAIEINPYSLEAYFNRAVSFKHLLEIVNFLRDLQEVVALGAANDPVVGEARSLLGEFGEMIKKSEGIELKEYLEAGDHFARGADLMDSGEWAGALEAFRASATLNEANAPCHGNMGICHAALGQKEEALADLDRALEIDPDYELARSNRRMFAQMAEGETPDEFSFTSINYAAEKLKGGRAHRSDRT